MIKQVKITLAVGILELIKGSIYSLSHPAWVGRGSFRLSIDRVISFLNLLLVFVLFGSVSDGLLSNFWSVIYEQSFKGQALWQQEVPDIVTPDS